jgi:hypothetical protein
LNLQSRVFFRTGNHGLSLQLLSAYCLQTLRIYPSLTFITGTHRPKRGVCVCVCVCVHAPVFCVFRLQVPGEPKPQSNKEGTGLGLLPHKGPARRVEAGFTFSFSGLCSSSATASADLGACLPSSRSNPEAVDTASGWGARETASIPGSPGAAATQPRCPTHPLS